MKLATDLYDPADLTGYTRQSLEEYERSKGTLAQFLPNRTVNDIVARFTVGDTGLTPVAEYRSYDAETPIGGGKTGKRVTIELPPLGRKSRISELEQIRNRNASDEFKMTQVEDVAAKNGRAVSDRLELARGRLIATGKAVIDENGFIADADFGRDPSMSAVAATKWNASGATILDDLEAWKTAYIDKNNGAEPGVILVSQKVISALARSTEFRSLAKNSTDVSVVSVEFINTVLESFGYPRLARYDRRVNIGGAMTRVLPENSLFFLPSPVAVDDVEGTDLGSTVWGTTLEADDPRYAIAEDDRPGIVVGAYTTEDPMASWIKSAAISTPVLANANLAMAAQVLP